MNLRGLAAIIILSAVLLAGCSAAGGQAQPAGGLPKVLAAETFLGDIAQNVAGTRLKVDTLLPPGVDPHEFQLSPQDAIKISQSQVLIINGAGYETWLTKSLPQTESQQVTVIATDGLTQTPDGNPHMWMDPSNVVRYAENIRDGLTKADPAGEAIYAANADKYIGTLKDLDRWIKGQVGQIPSERRLLVTNHAELGYFAIAYGLQIVGAVIPNVSNEASPSAQEMASLIQTIKSRSVPAIFLDVSENPNLANQIASESGAKVITDLYVETLSAPDGPAPTYIDMLKHDATAIVTALK